MFLFSECIIFWVRRIEVFVSERLSAAVAFYDDEDEVTRQIRLDIQTNTVTICADQVVTSLTFSLSIVTETIFCTIVFRKRTIETREQSCARPGTGGAHPSRGATF